MNNGHKAGLWRRSRRGVLLVDALVGMVCLTVALGAIVSAMLVGMRAGRRGRELQNAGLAARQVVENIRGFKGAAVADGTYQDATVLGVVPQLSTLNNGAVSAQVSTFHTRAHQVVVTVSWYSVAAKRTQTQKFTTLISSEGVSK